MMQVLKVTTKAEDHDVPKGAKIMALTDNSGRTTYIDFEGEAGPKSETSQRLNSGRNIFKVPDKCTSFSIVGEEEFSIGVDFIQSSEDEGGGDARLESLEARVTALEAAASQQASQSEPKQKPENDHSTKGYAARKK